MRRGKDTHMHREEGHVTMEAEIGMKDPESQGLPGASRR